MSKRFSIEIVPVPLKKLFHIYVFMYYLKKISFYKLLNWKEEYYRIIRYQKESITSHFNNRKNNVNNSESICIFGELFLSLS